MNRVLSHLECLLIDTITILVIRLCVDIFIAVVFLTFVRRHPDIGGPGWWAMAAGMSLLGSAGLAMSLAQPDPFPVALAFTAVAAAFVASWLGLRSYLGLPIPLRAMLVGLLLMGLAELALVAVSDDVAPRRALFGVVVMALAALNLRDVRQVDPGRKRHELQPVRWLAWGEIGLLGFLSVRVWTFAPQDPVYLIKGTAPYVLLVFTIDFLARVAIGTYLVSIRLNQERDQATRELQARERESRSLVENLSASVMVFRPDETLVSINAAGRRFLGWPAIVGRDEYMELAPQLRLLDEEERPLARSAIPLNRVLAAREPVNGMVLGVQTRHRAEVRWALCNGYPQFDARGQLENVVLTYVDITALKHAEAGHQILQAQLMQAQKMESLGTLAGGVAHDFNNILAAILGNTELARKDLATDAPAQESLNEITVAARRGRELVRQILAFSRRQPMARKPVLVNGVVDESCRLLRAVLPPQVELVYSPDPQAPCIQADATQLGQVLLNLGTNALQALDGRSGRVEFKVETLQCSDPRVPPDVARGGLAASMNVVCVTVSDNGPGMADATRERIFEPFFTTKEPGQGTGLGLPVALGIVQTHGGAIEVKSELGQGTVFSLFFVGAAWRSPVDGTNGGTMNQVGGAKMEWGQATSTARIKEDMEMGEDTNAAGRHIIYLDDDDTLVFLVRRLLERRGYQVSGFTEQEKAIEAIRNEPGAFHLLLTDYNMPGMSGIEVARQVRDISPGLPVAVASGYITDELKDEALAVGVREVVFKTDAVEAFCDVVARLVR